MVAYRQRFDYKFVLMAGDNIYEGPATEEDYRLKFEEPYKLLLDAGVKFYAALGNHDDTNQIFYKPFNMDGRSLLHVRAAGRSDHALGHARALLRARQHLSRLRADAMVREGSRPSRARSGRSRSCIIRSTRPGRYTLAARGIRFALESAFVNGGVDVVFSGHEHIYERAELQNGILYFITGGAGSLRAGRRGAVAARSRAATTGTITSCWPRSPTMDSSSRRSTARA